VMPFVMTGEERAPRLLPWDGESRDIAAMAIRRLLALGLPLHLRMDAHDALMHRELCARR